MKTACMILIAAAAIAGSSCKRAPTRGFPLPEAAAAEAPQAEAPAIAPEVQKRVRQQGDAVAMQAYGLLTTRLGKAIAEAGMLDALEFCTVHGITFTSWTGITNEVVVRRVTHKPRNPKNRADDTELRVIRQFEKELSKHSAPRPIVMANKPSLYTYYAPIIVDFRLCLSCHGQPGAEIKPDVLAQAKKTYPNDEATGFKLGDLRGIWSIDFKRNDFEAAER